MIGRDRLFEPRRLGSYQVTSGKASKREGLHNSSGTMSRDGKHECTLKSDADFLPGKAVLLYFTVW